MSKSILLGVAGDSKSLVNIYKAGVFLALKIIKLLKKLKFIKNKIRYQEYENGSLNLAKDYLRKN